MSIFYPIDLFVVVLTFHPKGFPPKRESDTSVVSLGRQPLVPGRARLGRGFSDTVFNTGRCMFAQNFFGANLMLSQVQSTTVVNAGCCVVTHLKFVEIQNLEGRRQSRHLQCCSLRTAYHQALVFHRNESQTKCCLAVTSTTHAWQSKAIFSVEGHRWCRAPQLSTQGVVCVHGSFSSVRIEGDCPEVLFARGTS